MLRHERLLDNTLLDEITYRLYVLNKVQQGLQDIEAGKTISSEELAREIQTWQHTLGPLRSPVTKDDSILTGDLTFPNCTHLSDPNQDDHGRSTASSLNPRTMAEKLPP